MARGHPAKLNVVNEGNAQQV